MLNTTYPRKEGFILQPEVAHFEKFAAAHSSAKLFSRRVLRHSMATTSLAPRLSVGGERESLVWGLRSIF